MKTEQEIRERIDFLTNEMYKMKGSQPADVFSYMEDKRKSVGDYEELKHIYWVLDEPLPEIIESLRKQ